MESLRDAEEILLRDSPFGIGELSPKRWQSERRLTLKEIVIATRNGDKERELKQLLRGLKLRVQALDKYPGCPEVKEGNRSFRENAIRKAMAVSKFSGKVAIADDSGLEVDALDGRPGIRSSRFAGRSATYADNNRKLLRMLKAKTDRERAAQFRCVVAVCNYPKLVGVAEGRIRGKITDKPKGASGFGYDPIFVVPQFKKTFAQLKPEIKNKISHRARALKKAKKILRAYWKLGHTPPRLRGAAVRGKGAKAAPSRPPQGKSGAKSWSGLFVCL